MLRLLIVNDEEIAVRGMVEGIAWQECGIEIPVLVAFDAKQATDILERESVDIILCDIEMPGENGIQLIRHVRNAKMPIACIFLTCHAKFEYAQEALKLGCFDYILTPAPYETVAHTISTLVKQLNIERENESILKYGSSWLAEQQDQAAQNQGNWRSPEVVVESTENYIINNLQDEGMSVSTIAANQFLNVDYLNRIFKREKGIAIRQFIIRERMALAARLLKEQTLSVGAVARQAGYPNVSYFITVFKRHTGNTPTEYQEKIKSENLYQGSD